MTTDSTTYQVLARKWRPQRFSELVGQEHITRTLQNTIKQGRVGHAYLFVGPRGIGKTSSARIFAKALNCDQGVVTEPCCECASCREITNGSSVDVIEIDGASHNSVTDVRSIRDNVIYTPSRSRYKIYIIDEVHMLSVQAWNALLKTLEEPPPHVKFFFATTEPHKVLPTVISRCQRFDLRRIPVSVIVKRLAEIAQSENVNADERALAAIGRAADGGMRDALSIFDQIIAFCGGRDNVEMIKEEDVIDVFGLASATELKQLANGILTNRLTDVMAVIQRLADQGRDLERLYGDLVLYMRNVMICTVCPDPGDLLEVSPSELVDLREIADSANPALVPRVLEGLVTGESAIRNALNKRVYIEATVVRVMRNAHSVQIDDLIARLDELRRGGTTVPISATPVTRAVSTPAPVAPPVPAPVEVLGTVAPAPREPVAATPPVQSPPQPPPAPPAPPPPEPAPPPAPEPQPQQEETPRKQVVEPPPPPPRPAAAGPSTPFDALPPIGPDEDEVPLEPGPPAPVATAPPEPLPVPAPPPPPELQPEAPRDVPPPSARNADDSVAGAGLWHKLIEEVGHLPNKQQLRNYMQELRPVSFINGVLHVAYDDEFPVEHVSLIEQADNQAVIQRCFRRVSPIPDGKVLFKRWIDSLSSNETRQRKTASPEVMARVKQNAFVREVCDLFDGEIVDARG